MRISKKNCCARKKINQKKDKDNFLYLNQHPKYVWGYKKPSLIKTDQYNHRIRVFGRAGTKHSCFRNVGVWFPFTSPSKHCPTNLKVDETSESPVLGSLSLDLKYLEKPAAHRMFFRIFFYPSTIKYRFVQSGSWQACWEETLFFFLYVTGHLCIISLSFVYSSVSVVLNSHYKNVIRVAQVWQMD